MNSVNAAAPAPVPDGTYRVSSLSGHSSTTTEAISLSFNGKQLSATAGCNTMTGTYSIDGTLLKVQLTSTLMACSPASVMDDETWLANFLQLAPTITVDTDQVLLTSSDTAGVAMVLERQPDVADAALSGTSWLLGTVVRNDIAASVPDGVAATLSIADGRLTMGAGCNGLGGDVVVNDDTLLVSPVIGTQIFCDDARNDVETLLGSVVQGQVTYLITGPQLTITGADGTQLIFTEDSAVTGSDATESASAPSVDLGTDVFETPARTASTTPDVSVPGPTA